MKPTYKQSHQGEISAFNEGALQMQRIDRLQERINTLNISPLLKDRDTNRFNYEIIFSSLNSLFTEVSSKLSTDEREEGIKIKKEIEKFMKEKPIFTEPYKTRDSKGKIVHRVDINVDNWNKLQEKLFDYELKIREFLERHNLTAPKGERPEYAAYK